MSRNVNDDVTMNTPILLQVIKNCTEHHYNRDDLRDPQSLHAQRGVTYHIANTLLSGRYCNQSEQQGGLTHIWPCLSFQRLPFTPDCKFCVKIFWDIIVIQTPLLTMAVFISCLLKDTYCIDLTNFIPSILTYMQFYLHSVKWGGGDGGSWLLKYWPIVYLQGFLYPRSQGISYSLVPWRCLSVTRLDMSTWQKWAKRMSSLVVKSKTTYRTKHRASSRRSLHRAALWQWFNNAKFLRTFSTYKWSSTKIFS